MLQSRVLFTTTRVARVGRDISDSRSSSTKELCCKVYPLPHICCTIYFVVDRGHNFLDEAKPA